ncbi:MAG: hypothetical protein IH998_15450 [Proteobacteria bacterium]|nr:hypothetical protein [Pseudomonadota bacterium]
MEAGDLGLGIELHAVEIDVVGLHLDLRHPEIALEAVALDRDGAVLHPEAAIVAIVRLHVDRHRGAGAAVAGGEREGKQQKGQATHRRSPLVYRKGNTLTEAHGRHKKGVGFGG